MLRCDLSHILLGTGRKRKMQRRKGRRRNIFEEKFSIPPVEVVEVKIVPPRTPYKKCTAYGEELSDITPYIGRHRIRYPVRSA